MLPTITNNSMPYTIDDVKRAFVAADDKARSGDAQAKQDAAMFAQKIREMSAAPDTPIAQASPSLSPDVPDAPQGLTVPPPVPDSTQQWKNAIVPGHPLDSMVNGLRAMMGWGVEHKGAIADMAMEGGAPAIGQRVAGPIGGFAGGVIGDTLAQIHQISTSDHNVDFKPGQALGAGVVGAFPMAGMKGASANKVALESGTQALVNLAAEIASTGIDKQALPTPEQMGNAATYGAFSPLVARLVDAGKLAQKETIRQGKFSYDDETFLNAHNAGLLLDPAKSNPTATTKLVSSLAAQTPVQKAAAAHNLQVAQDLAREELKLPPDVPMSPLVLADQRMKLAEPYRELAKISSSASDMVKEWEGAKADAKDYMKAYGRDHQPDTRKKAISAQNDAIAAEQLLQQEAVKVGRPDLVDAMKSASREIAKNHAVDSALIGGTTKIDPLVLGAMVDSRAPLSGNLAIIGRLAAAMPEVMTVPTNQPVGWSRIAARSTPAALGMFIGGPAGAAVGGVAGFGIPWAAKKMALSQPYQAFMSLPKYGTNSPDISANAVRFATQSLGR